MAERSRRRRARHGAAAGNPLPDSAVQIGPPDPRRRYVLRRRGWTSRRVSLQDDSGTQLALLSLRVPVRVRFADRSAVVARARRLGPFELREPDGTVRAALEIRSTRREHAQLVAGDCRLELRRQRRFGRRILAVEDPTQGVAVGDPADGLLLGSPTARPQVGELRQHRVASLHHELLLPGTVPLDGIVLLSWWLAVLARRERMAMGRG